MSTVVLGGTGKTGRRVAERLHSLRQDVRIGSRSATPPFDWEEPATWEPSLRGATAAYVSYFPELTGPRALTFAEAVGEIARASGRPVRFTTITMSEFAAEMGVAGVPDDVVHLLAYLFGEVLDGRNVAVGDGVQRALGRPPREFRAFAERAWSEDNDPAWSPKRTSSATD